MADSPSSSALTQSSDASDSKIATYKQKLKILKKAYIKEQEEKNALSKQIMSYNKVIEKLQKDLNEKEQEYLKAYKENQKLHSDLIEERAGSNRHRGSVMVKSNDIEMFTGYPQRSRDDASPK